MISMPSDFLGTVLEKHMMDEHLQLKVKVSVNEEQETNFRIGTNSMVRFGNRVYRNQNLVMS